MDFYTLNIMEVYNTLSKNIDSIITLLCDNEL